MLIFKKGVFTKMSDIKQKELPQGTKSMDDGQKEFLKQLHDGNKHAVRQLTDAQKESIDFYCGNDYLLINNLMWGKFDKVDWAINIIDTDAIGVLKEADAIGVEKRWGVSKEEGERIYAAYKHRIVGTINNTSRLEKLKRAYNDIKNIRSAMSPLSEPITVYRNVSIKYLPQNCEKGQDMKNLAFSSTSLQKHDAKYHGSNEFFRYEIILPKNFPALILSEYGIGNEKDEAILPPFKFDILSIKQGDSENCKQIIQVQPTELIEIKYPNLDTVVKYCHTPQNELSK